MLVLGLGLSDQPQGSPDFVATRVIHVRPLAAGPACVAHLVDAPANRKGLPNVAVKQPPSITGLICQMVKLSL